MSTKKKILFFTTSNVGGAERVTLTIAKMLPRDSYDTKIIFVDRKIGNLTDFIPQWMPTIHIKIHNIWDFATIRMYHLIREEKPYAVFSSLYHINPRMILAAHMAGIKHIVVRNNIGWRVWKTSCKILAYLTYSMASTIVLQTEEMKNELQRIFPNLANRMKAIPNPIDAETIGEKLELAKNPFEEKDINYVYSGRISPEKGLDVLIEAFAKVRKAIQNSHLFIVGDNSQNKKYYEQLQCYIAKENLCDNVHFLGFQDNPYQYVKYANCFVLPSRKEGNPNVMHEALYLQTPVVATRSVPVVEQCVTTDRGYVIDIDDVDGMANAMLKALEIKNIPSYLYGDKNQFINLFK